MFLCIFKDSFSKLLNFLALLIVIGFLILEFLKLPSASRVVNNKHQNIKKEEAEHKKARKRRSSRIKTTKQKNREILSDLINKQHHLTKLEKREEKMEKEYKNLKVVTYNVGVDTDSLYTTTSPQSPQNSNCQDMTKNDSSMPDSWESRKKL